MGTISSPIPPNVVACVGGLNCATRSYCLWKDGQTIVVQAETLLEPHMREPGYLWSPPADVVFKLEKEYLFGLEHIQTLLHTIEFGKTNWAYMNVHPKGGYSISQRKKTLYKVRAPTWAPLIEEKEIIYTRWFLVDVRTGYWKGREVDVILGYENHYLKRIHDTMMGHLALRGMDLTYTVLAHVISSDGFIIGVVTEPEVGRLVQHRDRTLVYQAIARLQKHHLIFNGLHYSKIHILDGKVRLSNVASIAYFKDPIELQKEAEVRHWGPLKDLFEFLDPNDEVSLLSLERVSKQATLKLLPDHPSPERPLFVRFIWGTHFPEGFDNKRKFASNHRGNGRARKRDVLSLFVELVSESAETLEVDEAGAKDLPLSMKGARNQSRRETNQVFHPYRQRPRRVLLESSDSDRIKSFP